MNSSSQQSTYSITLDDGSIYSTTIDTDSVDYFPIQAELFYEEWIDIFPDWYKIQDMCQKYPSLDAALNNLKIIYELVKDDYDSQQNQDPST